MDNFLSLKTLSIAVLFLVLGGGITIGGLKIENPIGNWLKRIAVHDDYIIERFNQLQSYHAATAVLVAKKGDRFTSATLQDISTKANEFFGKRAESKDLIGKSGGELIEMLRHWMEPADYEAFVQDQNRLLKQYSADQEAHAKVPTVFNDKHPHQSHKHGIFLPVIVSLEPEEKKESERSEQVLEITYLDLRPIIPIVGKYKERPTPARVD